MLQGVDAYIRQEFRKPILSQVYWSSSTTLGATATLERNFDTQQKIKLIVTNSMWISTQGAGAAIVFTDNFGLELFRTTPAPGTFSMLNNFWYMFPGNKIKVTANVPPGAVLEFALSYQTVTEDISPRL